MCIKLRISAHRLEDIEIYYVVTEYVRNVQPIRLMMRHIF